MKRRFFAVLCAAVMILILCGCDLKDQLVGLLPTVDDSVRNGPGRMVQQIEVSLHPADANYERLYRSQDTLNSLLQLLRDMENSTEPESEPDLNGGQSYYAITAVYASGESQVYYLLGHRYLKIGDNPWCVVTSEQALSIIRFFQNHVSENPAHAVSEATLPTETGPHHR